MINVEYEIGCNEFEFEAETEAAADATPEDYATLVILMKRVQAGEYSIDEVVNWVDGFDIDEVETGDPMDENGEY